MAKKKVRSQSIKSHKKNSAPKAAHINKPRSYENLGVPSAQAKRFMALFDSQQFAEAQAFAQQLTQEFPQSAFAWKALGTSYLEAGRVEEAMPHLHKAVDLNERDPLALTSLAAVYYQQGDNENAVRYQEKAVALDSEYSPAQYRLAQMLHSAGRHQEALPQIKNAMDNGYDPFKSKILLGVLLYNSKLFKQAMDVYHLLEKEYPPNSSVLNNLGNLYKDLGEYEKSEYYYLEALTLEPDFVMAYSNAFFSKHYNPNVTQQEIKDFATKWDEKFALPALSQPSNLKDASKPLRVGLVSSGFRLHPVGQMITSALENSREDIHFYGYTTTDHTDFVTDKIRALCKKWQPIRHLTQQATAQQIRDDKIDILIDLSGHGDGSCMQAISMRPAPLCIKWVGGLVNTMGVAGIDYLLSDHIETPEGVDDQYTENLIRLPDDYICYMPCPYAPATTSLPVLKNRYITLGCLNNPAKISAQLLAEWATLMHEMPESRLLLRGAQYESDDFCRWIWEEMTNQGIEQHRVLLEGPTNHKDFIGTYQRIDIALDTWPYSGGLTTCEALLMGVPVVTLPGPTFAGRHSATHLINAGLQELVTSSWEEYRQRVKELANDLPNLAVIRAGLRTILHYSPVCDAPRFANHFNNALRAIWVRYCEGKAPEALTFNKEGELWFEDDKQPLELPEARSEEEPAAEQQTAFEWQLDEPITIIDNAAVLPRDPNYPKWMASGHLTVISFDPASILNKNVEALKEYGELHHYPHALLGDGQPATLYAALDAEKGSTLKPLPEAQQPEYLRDKVKTLAELPINTIRLDDIEGLPNVDMLVLDDLHAAIKVLENGEQTLKSTLLIQVKVAFQTTHERQPSLAELQYWAARNGFRFYRFERLNHCSHFPQRDDIKTKQSSELVSAGAIFIPSYERMEALNNGQRTKLAFLLHKVYGIKDMAYALLAAVGEEQAEQYLVGEELVGLTTDTLHNQGSVKPTYVPEPQAKAYQAAADNVSQDIDALLENSTERTEADTALQMASESVAIAPLESKKRQSNKKPNNLWELDEPIQVVDVGANPIDGTPPYAGLLDKGVVKLVGFEPQNDALQKLQATKGPNETYLPHAVGTGERTKLYICQASGMTSTLKPNNVVLDHFQGYPIWGKVKSVEEIDTVRLDDVAEIEKIDWLKIDIQGGELNVFKNGEEKLKDALVIQTEVNFIQLYENQPLFAEIDQWMRSHGFMLHTLLEQRKRLYAPMKINGGIHQGINQLTTADAVYIKDINSSQLTLEQRKKIAFILNKAYGSYDLAYRLLMNEQDFNKKDFFEKLVEKNIKAISIG